MHVSAEERLRQLKEPVELRATTVRPWLKRLGGRAQGELTSLREKSAIRGRAAAKSRQRTT
jgi:hypothetical protein